MNLSSFTGKAFLALAFVALAGHSAYGQDDRVRYDLEDLLDDGSKPLPGLFGAIGTRPIDQVLGEATDAPDGTEIAITARINFEYNKASLTPKAEATLLRFGEQLREALETERFATLQVMIEGHTDSIGSEAFNLALSQKRATNVRSYLIGIGLPPSRLLMTGKGESQHLAGLQPTDGANRRVEFVFAVE